MDRPLLAFAYCVSSVVTRRLLPPALGDRRGCTPGLSRRETSERSWLPTSAASSGRRAPGGAAGERVPRPSPKGERARRVVQRAVYRAPCRDPYGAPRRGRIWAGPLARATSTPRSPPSPSPGGPSVGGRLRPDRVWRGHRERWTAWSLAGLLSWLVLKDCPSVDIRGACPLPARCRPRPSGVPTWVGRRPCHRVPGPVRHPASWGRPWPFDARLDHRGFAAHLRPGVATPRVSFRPCRFSRLRRLSPRTRCRSVSPCCRP